MHHHVGAREPVAQLVQQADLIGGRHVLERDVPQVATHRPPHQRPEPLGGVRESLYPWYFRRQVEDGLQAQAALLALRRGQSLEHVVDLAAASLVGSVCAFLGGARPVRPAA